MSEKRKLPARASARLESAAKRRQHEESELDQRTQTQSQTSSQPQTPAKTPSQTPAQSLRKAKTSALAQTPSQSQTPSKGSRASKPATKTPPARKEKGKSSSRSRRQSRATSTSLPPPSADEDGDDSAFFGDSSQTPSQIPSPSSSLLPTPSPSPSPPPSPLPTSVDPRKPLPILKQRPSELPLPSTQYQSVSESGVLALSLQRSRQHWIEGGLFDKYWSKPSKKKNAVQDESNPSRDTMSKLGQVHITIEPHVLDAVMYAVKDPRQPSTTKSNNRYRPIMQYSESGATGNTYSSSQPPIPTAAPHTPSTVKPTAWLTPTSMSSDTPRPITTTPSTSFPIPKTTSTYTPSLSATNTTGITTTTTPAPSFNTGPALSSTSTMSTPISTSYSTSHTGTALAPKPPFPTSSSLPRTHSSTPVTSLALATSSNNPISTIPTPAVPGSLSTTSAPGTRPITTATPTTNTNTTPSANFTSVHPTSAAPTTSIPATTTATSINSRTPPVTTPGATGTAASSTAPAPKPAPPSKTTDPIIVALAERAAGDEKLRDLMKRVAEGKASSAELAHFQGVIDQITQEYTRNGGKQGPSADRLLVDNRTVQYFADEVKAILAVVYASNPAQRSYDLRPPPGSDPLVVLLVRAALDSAMIKDMIYRVANRQPRMSDAQTLKEHLDRLHLQIKGVKPSTTGTTTGSTGTVYGNTAAASATGPKFGNRTQPGPGTTTTHQMIRPAPTTTAATPLTPYGAARTDTAPYGSTATPKRGLYGAGSGVGGGMTQSQMNKFMDITGIVFEFVGGTGDRYSFPKNSILQYNGESLTASFLLVRPVASETADEEAEEKKKRGKGKKAKDHDGTKAERESTLDPETTDKKEKTDEGDANTNNSTRKSENKGDVEKPKYFYQPITVTITSPTPRLLDYFARVVAPVSEVRQAMEQCMNTMTRADCVLLALQLPRASGRSSAAANTNGVTDNNSDGREGDAVEPEAEQDKRLLWSGPFPKRSVQGHSSTTADAAATIYGSLAGTSGVAARGRGRAGVAALAAMTAAANRARFETGAMTEDEQQYQKFIQTLLPRE